MALRVLKTPLPELIYQLQQTGLPCAVEAAMLLQINFPEQAQHQPLTVDLNTNIVRRGGREVHVSPNEAVILHVLQQRVGRPTSVTDLTAAVNGPRIRAKPGGVRQAIPTLRRKVRRLGIDIVNEFKQGYRLEAVIKD